MTALVFVDTNVFVYARDSRQQLKQELAAAWIASLWHGQNGRTSTQVLSEYYVTLTRKLVPRIAQTDAWTAITALFSWQPQGHDQALLVRAREVEARYRLSWWDSMIVAAAQLQNCSILLTEDLQDGGVFAGVTVRSPFTLGINEPVPGYAVATSRPSHPSRGRPRSVAHVPRSS